MERHPHRPHGTVHRRATGSTMTTPPEPFTTTTRAHPAPADQSSHHCTSPWIHLAEVTAARLGAGPAAGPPKSSHPTRSKKPPPPTATPSSADVPEPGVLAESPAHPTASALLEPQPPGCTLSAPRP